MQSFLELAQANMSNRFETKSALQSSRRLVESVKFNSTNESKRTEKKYAKINDKKHKIIQKIKTRYFR
jgi:hypothetical protein